MRGFLPGAARSADFVTDRTVTAEDLVEFRRIKALPNLAVQTAQAACAMAKFAGDNAMHAGSGAARTAATDALARAGECVDALIHLESALNDDDDLPTMSVHLAATLNASAEAIRAAGRALAHADQRK